jgi:trehalose-6-phosphate synthase
MPSSAAQTSAVVVVANRLPVRHGDEGWELSPGGLVTALRPVMANHTGTWVGWDGGTKAIPPGAARSQRPAAADRSVRRAAP